MQPVSLQTRPLEYSAGPPLETDLIWPETQPFSSVAHTTALSWAKSCIPWPTPFLTQAFAQQGEDDKGLGASRQGAQTTHGAVPIY